MNIDNAKSQMRKGMLDYCVLLLLQREASYANDIIRSLKAAEFIVVEGTLYPLLTRLKKDGLLCYEWRESTQGPPRKYYSLTNAGKATLQELNNAWRELTRTINLLEEMTHEKQPHNAASAPPAPAIVIERVASPAPRKPAVAVAPAADAAPAAEPAPGEAEPTAAPPKAET